MSEQMTNQELEKFEQDFESIKPFLTDDVLGEIEQDMGSNQPWGPWRRVGLAFLTRSGKQLIESVEGDRDGAVAMAAAVNGTGDYAERLRELAKLMDTASTRLRMALCWRDDMEEIFQDAEAK